MPKKHQAERIGQTRALLAERFPQCFAAAGAPKRPLAIGIGESLMLCMPEIGFLNLQRALGDYTSGPTYLEHVVEGAQRIGVMGEEAGVVTVQEAAYAAARLKGLRTAWARADERRKARPRAEAAEEA